jgi:hypothetical protein
MIEASLHVKLRGVATCGEQRLDAPGERWVAGSWVFEVVIFLWEAIIVEEHLRPV